MISLHLLLLSFITLSRSVDITNSVSINNVRTLALDDIHNEKNESVQITGQITAVPGTYEDAQGYNTALGFTIQDSGAGVFVYVGDQSFYDTDTTKYAQLTLGRWVTVTGTYDTDKPILVVDPGGMVRLFPKTFDDVVIGDIEDVPEPIEIALDEVGASQGLLVVVRNVNITHLITSGAWGTDFRAADAGGKSTSIWYYPSWTADMVEVGTEYEYIIGFASVYVNCSDAHILEDYWEIWPRSVDDWSKESKGIMSGVSKGIIGFCIFVVFMNNL